MVGFLIFSGLLTGFIQINIDGSVDAGSDSSAGDYHVLDLNKNLNQTVSLNMENGLSGYFNTFSKKTDKISKVNAVKLDQKTLIIKGFNENIDPALLKTIDLNIKNIAESTSTNIGESGFEHGTDIVPVVLDVDVSGDVVELVDSDGDISEYEVAPGDTLSSIAEKHNISVETILWANDLNSKSTIKVGQKLVILPVSGLSYKVKKGDTVSGLASRFGVTEDDIVGFNKTEGNKLIIGETIIIPGAKLADKPSNNPKNQTNKGNNDKPKNNTSAGYFVRPINGIKTQGIHGYNGIDFGAPIGTAVYAAASGVVTLVRGGDAWNGGYGNYIVIKHQNGTQTLYAHLDSIGVNIGQTVDRGDVIGRSGNTGRSTGPHLHFEVRGARNPF